MRYSKVRLEALGYELGPVVVGSAELESRLKPLYDKLHLSEGQLEELTGIGERRWWEEGYPLSEGAVCAAKKALEGSGVRAKDIGALVYAGVCRENFEPATACRVAHGLGMDGDAAVYDISNACLGVLNGIVDLANRIELGQIRAGLVVSCESAREINERMISRMLADGGMAFFKTALAALTGGSGASALLLTDGSFGGVRQGPVVPGGLVPSPGGGGFRRRLLGGAARTAPEHHALSIWGLDKGTGNGISEFMWVDPVGVLQHGVKLGVRTFAALQKTLGWTKDDVDKVICHQVGAANKDSILAELGIPEGKDFSSFSYLGNMGTVSLPLTAALAEERGFLKPGDRVGFLGIGSGLNCLMLGWEW